MRLPRHVIIVILGSVLAVPPNAQDKQTESADDLVCGGIEIDFDSNLLGERQELVVKELRSVGSAIECYALDELSYPGPSSGVRTFEYLSAFLSPAYMGEVFTTDVWGNDYLYWSDGADYALVSFGSDRASDLDYDAAFAEPWEIAREKVCRGESHDTAADIVFANGNHCSWYRAKRE